MSKESWEFKCIDCEQEFNDPDNATIHISVWNHTVKGGWSKY